MKISLRRLRKLARQGAEDEFDIDNTIDKTAKNGGMLDIIMRPERRNTVKVLLILDNGGSMDAHVKVCEELFSAARSEFKYLETYYFHNFIYDGLWKQPTHERAYRHFRYSSQIYARLQSHLCGGCHDGTL